MASLSDNLCGAWPAAPTLLTTHFSQTTDMRSSMPFVPSGMSVKLSLPTAFWAVVKVQWALPVTWRSPLRKVGVGGAHGGLIFLSQQRPPSALSPSPASTAHRCWRVSGRAGQSCRPRLGLRRAGADECGASAWDVLGQCLCRSWTCRRIEATGSGGGGCGARGPQQDHPGAGPYLDNREVRWSAVLGSGLTGGDVTKAAAFAQFLLQ